MAIGAVITEVATYITTLGISGLTVLDGNANATVFRSFLPETPDFACVVKKYGGAPPEGQFGVVGPKWEHPGIQVTVRGLPNDYATPDAAASTIFVAMGNLMVTSLGGTEYLTISAVQSPFQFGPKDGRERIYIMCNYLLNKAVS